MEYLFYFFIEVEHKTIFINYRKDNFPYFKILF